MITKESLEIANKMCKTIPIHKKEYATANERIKAFRSIEPEGAIVTEWLVIDLVQGFCASKTTIYDAEGNILATGTAYEREQSSPVNKTSFIENCETSSVARAIGMVGIGIDTAICSYEELNNALENQDNLATDTEKREFVKLCSERGVNPNDILKTIGWKSGPMTKDQYQEVMSKLGE